MEKTVIIFMSLAVFVSLISLLFIIISGFIAKKRGMDADVGSGDEDSTADKNKKKKQ